MAKFLYGEYVRVEVLAATRLHKPMFVWMRVEHCDDRHGIVYGVVDDQGSDELGRALASGAKLAASYRTVRERRTPAQ